MLFYRSPRPSFFVPFCAQAGIAKKAEGKAKSDERALATASESAQKYGVEVAALKSSLKNLQDKK